MLKPTGAMNYPRFSYGALASTDTVHSDAGGSSFDNSLHYVAQQVGWFSSRSASQYLIHVWCTLTQNSVVSESSESTRKPSHLHCPVCGKTFGRLQEAHRHISSVHLPCWLYCPHSPCLWRGHRKEEFKTHLRVHPGSDPGVSPCPIYDLKLVLNLIKEGIPFEAAAGHALELVLEKARELGFTEEWSNLWG